MSHELVSLNFGHVRETVSGWSREQESFEADVTESLAALEAYQSHLEAWQRELAQERAALANERSVQAAVGQAADAEIAKLTELVASGKERIASLESDLLACNEELREAEEKRTEVISQLDAARTREKLLTSAPTASGTSTTKKKANSPRKQSAERNFEEEPDSDSAVHDSQVGDPVLKSVVAQFDKIRRQLAFGKQRQDSAE